MSTVYPNQIDDNSTLPQAFTTVSTDIFNQLRGAVLAIESELGVNPSISYPDVRARLDAIQALIDQLETDIGNIITGGTITFAGDLTGDGYSQTVVGLYNRPINNSTPAIGQSLGWNGTQWAPIYGSGNPIGPAGGDLSGTYPNPTVVKLNGVSIPPTPSINQVLIANNATSASYGLLTDQNISPSAAIAGTKINPNFGSQNITTTGTLTSTSIQTPYIDNPTILTIGTSAFSIQIGSEISISNSKVDTSSAGQRVKIVSVNSNYNITDGDYALSVDTLSSSHTIYMPPTPTDGDIYLVKDATGNSFNNNIILDGNGNLIDGNPVVAIDLNGSWHLI
jgi:hypothetical protein